MERIVWTEAYSVGQSAIDGQHQRLITIVNTLIEHRNEQAYWVETCAAQRQLLAVPPPVTSVFRCRPRSLTIP